MLRSIVSRLSLAVILVLLATLAVFLIANAVPGDPVLAQLGDMAASSPEIGKDFRVKWGLDLPL